MKILLLSDLYPPVVGGLEHHVDALAAELGRRGNDVRVATLTSNPTPSSPSVHVHTVRSLAPRLPHERADRPFHPPVSEPITRRSLLSLLRRFDPDVVHAHSAIVASVPRRRRQPLVFTAHDYGSICQVRTMVLPSGAACSGPAIAKCVRCGTAQYGRITSTALTLGTAWSARRDLPDRVLAVSSAVRDALATHLRTPISVVPNFVGEAPAPEPLPDQVPASGYVLYAGDPGEHKGVPDLLSVWREHGSWLPPLLMATPRPLTSTVPPGVHTVSLTRAQMQTAWHGAVLAVVPSRWPDPCPTVVLEAMRAGVPVVGTNVGGIPELVRDRADGVLVPPRDPPALTRAILDLITDQDRRTTMSRSAARRAEMFTVSAITDRLVDIYGEEVTRRAERDAGAGR